MIVEPFKPEHLDEIELDKSQHVVMEDERAYRRMLATAGPCYTARLDDGKILACFGLINCSSEHGVAWMFTSIHVHHHAVAFHRAALRIIPLLGRRQVQATTDGSGCRWLARLGFTQHDVLPGFGPDGRDHLRYVRNF